MHGNSVDQPIPDPVRAWTLLPGLAQAHALLASLNAGVWAAPHAYSSVQAVLEALRDAAAPPELLITRVRLPDGDAFELIRRLAALRQPPALFLVSSQQSAVIKAAIALCQAHGIPYAGHANLPLTPDHILRQLAAFRSTGPVRASVAARAPSVTNAALQALVAQRGIRAYLQPKMRLSTSRVTGFEALMRGVDASGALLVPSELIEPLANAGLLLPATLQVFDQTVDFLLDCLNDGIAVGASVNVSLSLISDYQFCRGLVQRVESAGLDPSWITIEITEDEAMSNLALVIENTARIRMFGFNLSIDDFGTAYSSFAQLTKIPFSELKIERSFISGIEADKSKQAVVSACAQLGSHLGMAVVAEGVETAAELGTVRSVGCSDVQGYLLSQPMPVAIAAAWLRRHDGEGLELGADPATARPHCASGAS